jgi:hypothetical protein
VIKICAYDKICGIKVMKCFGEVMHEIFIITYIIEISMNQSTTKSHLQN